jgi:hypothetical protein
LKILGVINISKKVRGYKIDIQKSITFPYNNSEQTAKEFKKKIPFTIVSKST